MSNQMSKPSIKMSKFSKHIATNQRKSLKALENNHEKASEYQYRATLNNTQRDESPRNF